MIRGKAQNDHAWRHTGQLRKVSTTEKNSVSPSETLSVGNVRVDGGGGGFDIGGRPGI